jgi:hypothetical protein
VFAASLKDIRPAEGLMLKTPWNEAGIDTDPPISVPKPKALPLNACIAPSPRKHQFRGATPNMGEKDKKRKECLPDLLMSRLSRGFDCRD